ncbi:hypothetical protein SAMN04487831_103263 [Pseudobutyrivibrio sp. UC1225]|uniref:hypothetical protein n=1 Tax=Pseudobutyrivibrio sp. UC1225 TaxID=1798185 RepID=UPI0008E24EFF|nr:hypothetical protein [Pseudobutyrivibrio sp. UC1225]SFN78020.1 hypothetical protein SAMN04487831_103263 [Pseudobutyrivibrio sp. UC1225]
MSGVKRRIIIILGFIISAALMLAYICYTGNQNQVFTDVVNEYTALMGSNISSQRDTFYIFSFLGMILVSLYYLLFNNKKYEEQQSGRVGADKLILLALGMNIAIEMIVYQSYNWIAIVALLFAVVIAAKDEKLVVSGTAFLFVTVYALCGLYRLYVLKGGMKSVSEVQIAIAALTISALFFFLLGSEVAFVRGILIAQLVIPFTLLTYLISKYLFENNEYINIPVPKKVKVLVCMLIVCFISEAIYKIIKNWKTANSLSDVLAYGTCVSIISFNRYSGTGAIITNDLHHTAENIIGYFQMVKLGQKAFSEYIPVSGMYSIVHGFFLDFFGNGQYSYYYLTTNVFFLFITLLIVFLLKRQVKGEWMLLATLVFSVIDYNRVALIVPSILILTLPELIKDKNKWLKAWFLTSYIHGLFYPVFGAAVCAGFLPFGIWQIYGYVKSGKLKEDIKTVSFWIWWAMCCIPVLLGVPYLIGTVKHMKAMADQTVYADGYARFGQPILDIFFPYITSEPVKLALWYLFSFLFVILVVWVSAILFFENGKVHLYKWKLRIENPEAGFMSISVSLLLLISFSYSVIRLSTGSIYERNIGVIWAAFIIMLVILDRYMKDNYKTAILFGYVIFMISVLGGIGFTNISSASKLEAYYTVPEEFVYVKNDQVKRLGEGFIKNTNYDSLEQAYERIIDLDKDKSYLGRVSDFFYFYCFDIKGDSVLEINPTIRGYGAAQETVDLIRKNGTIVGTNLNPVDNYYFYHWLVTSGEYVYDENTYAFYPNHGEFTVEEAREKNKASNLAAEDYNLIFSAGSWGSSMDCLESIFKDINIDYKIVEADDGIKIEFNSKIKGEEFDYLYLDFDGISNQYNYFYQNVLWDDRPKLQKLLTKRYYNMDKMVYISWVDDVNEVHNIACQIDEGKLLIPIGAARGWLFDSHSFLSIQVRPSFDGGKIPSINKLRLLKLREVR